MLLVILRTLFSELEGKVGKKDGEHRMSFKNLEVDSQYSHMDNRVLCGGQTVSLAIINGRQPSKS
jgi:hypothetical protein